MFAENVGNVRRKKAGNCLVALTLRSQEPILPLEVRSFVSKARHFSHSSCYDWPFPLMIMISSQGGRD